MPDDAHKPDSREIAGEIIERSPAIAMRVAYRGDVATTEFITRNVSAYGYSHEDFMSGRLSWIDLVHPEDRDDLVTLLRGFGEMGNDRYSIVYRIIGADGMPVWISDTSVVIRDDEGRILYTDSVISDYTETKQHIERIGENFRQQAVLNEILQEIHTVDLDRALQTILDRTGSHLGISRVLLFQNAADGLSCQAMQEWCNRGISSIMDKGDMRLSYADDIPEIGAALVDKGRIIVNYGEIPPGCVDEFENENVIASAMFAVTIQDEFFGFIAFDECIRQLAWNRETVRFLDNVSRLIAPLIIRRRHEQIIQAMALTDQLTGLNNRYCLERRLTAAIAEARDLGQSGYVLFIDMDDFKIINDAYGHDYGDAILREVAAFLKVQFGDPEKVFRFGGDEFVILLTPDRAKNIYDIMSDLLQRAQLPWNVIDRTFYCTLSIGVVRFPEGSEDSTEILKNADIAMYQAKKMGKNNYVFYTSTLDNDSVARAEMENAMRESIDNDFDGFEVYYQPLAGLDARVIGAEALIRWNLPDGRRLSPTQFIPLAEYLGLVIPIGEFVMRSAVRFCREVNRFAPDFFVSVNVSIRQFKQQEFLDDILDIIEEAGVRKTNIVMEITEGMAIHDMQRMKMIVGELRKHGIRVSMDDFGTGYSSLANLRELPIDVVKIDRSFIHDVTTDAYSRSFIRFISDLVHSMGRKVCVEGVEMPGQLRYCRECGVDYVQGFYLWRPMPEEELLELMQKGGVWESGKVYAGKGV